MTEPLLAGLARWSAVEVAGFAHRHPAAVAEATRDWLSALAAGAAEPQASRLALAGLSGSGSDAFRLGALSHLAEVDDGIGSAMIHPGVVTLPVLFALARTDGMTVGRFSAGLAAGYEAAARIGAALGKPHYRHFHMTGTAGSMAAALAGSTVLGLNADTALHAMGLGGTQAAGLWQVVDDGASEAKAAHAGFAARNGLYAARLAQAGIAGPSRALEGRRGLAAATGIHLDTDPLAAPFEDRTSGLVMRTVKPWPVCGQMFHILDALLPVAPADPVSVEIESFAALVEVAGVESPKSIPEARFSTSFCVAHLLLHGRLDFGDLGRPGVLDDPAIRTFADRVVLAEDARFTHDYPARRAGRITLVAADGSRRVIAAEGRRGGPDRPLKDVELVARFDRLTNAMPVVWRDAADRLDTLLRQGDPESPIPHELIESLCDVD